VFDTELRSLNEFLGGRHWASGRKHWKDTKRIWIPLVRAELGIPIPHSEEGKRFVRIERWLGPRQRKWDDENRHGGSVKCVCDALVRLGWLRDDSPKWRELLVLQRHRSDLLPHEFAQWRRGIRTFLSVSGGEMR